MYTTVNTICVSSQAVCMTPRHTPGACMVVAVVGGYSLTYGIYIWDMESLYRFSGRPCSTFSAYTDSCETLGCSGRTLRIILSSKSKLQNLIGAQQRARRALAARRHCVGGAVATTMAGSWWGSLSVIYECCGLCISMAVTTEALDTAGVR